MYVNKLIEHIVVSLLGIIILLSMLVSSVMFIKVKSDNDSLRDDRLITSYFHTKIHSNDKAEAISIVQFGNKDALMFKDETLDGIYLNIIYCHDGWLKELYIPENTKPELDSGEKIYQMSELSLYSDSPNLIEVEQKCINGEVLKSNVYLRSDC